ncbi:hypothetical protein M0R45_021501 [Rubus argutus]|uniref:DUF3444 domain-containing protein n=1 Tax=Rubus argutus TaxID=59490 RepID=A0AAW1XCT9_RUBAR
MFEVQNILADKARKEIRRKLNEQKSETAVKQVANGNETENFLKNIDAQRDQNKSGEPVDSKNGASERKHSGTSAAIADAETLQPMTITVPDSDFHDFDRDRTEESFGENQGDVWALYRNWSPDWNELTADEVIHKYDMVEVVEDYNEELGVTVTPLVKVAGFKTVFHRHLDPREVRRIPREEMFRFSHHVPSYLHTGQEASNAPKGCRELDPAATPLDLLQVITDVKDEDIMEIDEKLKEVDVIDLDVDNTNVIKEIAEDSRTVMEEEKGSSITPIIEIEDSQETKQDERVEHASEV